MYSLWPGRENSSITSAVCNGHSQTHRRPSSRVQKGSYGLRLVAVSSFAQGHRIVARDTELD